MAPSKRPRAPDDDGTPSSSPEEQVEVLESASSNLQSQAKRPRLSTSAEREVRSATVESNLAELPSTQFHRHTGHLEEYQRARDEVSVLPDDEDEFLLQQQTQKDNYQKNSRGDRVAAENGILEQVVVTNFMCHTKLEVKFGPHINFIIGHNGSGKSAVLTAITLCLGGKATSTNRGQNLKAFIKEGTDQATLQVRIKNQGDGAYRHDEYGDSIIVERFFNAHGTSGFKLKNRDGRIVSTKRLDLDDITDYYALQLDNPVNVLTQDMSRQFLAGSTATDKYKFFIKGVQLEQLDQDYCVLGDSLDSTEQELERSQEACLIKRQKQDDARKKYEQSRASTNLRERIKAVRRQMAWVQVEGVEKDLNKKKEDVTRAERRIAKCQQDYEQKSNAYDEACQASDEAAAQVSALQEEQPSLTGRFDEAKARFDQVKSQMLEMQHQFRNARSELDSHQQRLKRAQDAVQAEQQRLADVGGEAEVAKTAELQQAETTLAEARQAIDDHGPKIQQLQRDDKEAKNAYENSEKFRQAKVQDVRQGESRLNDLTRGGHSDPWKGFMPNMETLVKSIARETRFKKKPVGPLGKHVRLLKPDWSSILESYCGNSLNGFAVTCQEDQRLLADMMRRNRCQVPIFLGSEAPLQNIRQPSEFTTIMKILSIDNELVRKHLVINQMIDQTVLMDSSKEALDLMRNSNRFPENVKSILTKHPNKVGAGNRWFFTPSGGQSSAPIRPYGRPAVRMDMDDQEAINAQKEAVSRLKADLFQAEQRKQALGNQCNEASKAIHRHGRDGTTLREKEQRASELVADIKEQLEQLRPTDGQLDALKEQVTEEEQQVSHYRSQMEEVKASQEETALQNRDNKRAMDEAQANVDSRQTEIDAAEERARKYTGGKQRTLREKNEYAERVKDAEENKTREENGVGELEKALDEFTRDATKVSERVPVVCGETYSSLDKKNARLMQELTRHERALGAPIEVLAQRAKQARDECKQAERDFESAERLRHVLSNALISRRTRWKKFRQAISIRARSSFGQLLTERSFRGRMIIDHATKQLELSVQPVATRAARAKEASAGQTTSSLSGGEKSFSTICMLLALWEAMGSPIRCLDEFDVFMDNVNRDISMRMLIDAARGSAGRQYIFITPQAMGRTAGPDVRVIKLNDPERGQQTLTQVS